MLADMTGAEFRKWRKSHKLTQRQLWEGLGVTKMTIYRWENEKDTIPKTVVLALEELRRRISSSPTV